MQIKIKTRICSKCSELKSITEFGVRKRWCKQCRSAYSKAYRLANDDLVKAYSKAYRLANKDLIKASSKKYSLANKERKKAYNLANRERIKATKKAYYLAHKDKTNTVPKEKVSK